MAVHGILPGLISEATKNGNDFAMAFTKDFLTGEWRWEAWAGGVDRMLARDQEAPEFYASHSTAEGAVRQIIALMKSA